ncbi:MAG: amino acid permease [Bacteroidetes bacterium]|nr:amino acid permease [Bacteroidota bacterium]MCB0803705.1 amino acid permease [Flavobacteriales bacterium]NOG56703.1 amino acid permease [Bacteroidota bacterium]
MYLRFGWVVGNVGLTGTLIIVTLATSITFLTSLSIASIATDQKVKTGGAYYMISRSLGIESGGAIGISLYFAQAFSIALYTIGFAESIVQVFPAASEKIVGLITAVLITIVAITSAKTAIKAQYVIMVGIALSLISLFFGSPLETFDPNQTPIVPENSVGFWTVFAVFFPAVTGIMAGVNMSGDLKNPNRSIPRGTFAAIAVGYVIYMIVPVIIFNRADTINLIEDPMILRRISFWGDAILIGVWGATLSSALGSVLGAPRVLQALARDGILPKILKWTGKGSGSDDSPRLGTLFTLAIVLISIWLGDLNLIAPVLTMFFLTTYSVLNIAAGSEQFLKSPSFRPKFKVHWIFSLVGAISCIGVMFLINSGATFIALVFVALIFIWLKGRGLQTSFGNISRGIRMAIIKSSLMKISEEQDAKTWRPNPLVLVGSPKKRWHLIEFADALTHKRGILSVVSIIPKGSVAYSKLAQMKKHIQIYLKKQGVECLVKVIPAENPYVGVTHVAESYGLGALQPNTIIIGESQTDGSQEDYCEMIRRFYELNRNVLIVHKANKGITFGKKRRIDIWWGGLKGNGGLMMILAHLVNDSIEWRLATVHIKMVINDKNAIDSTRLNMAKMLEEIRIKAKIDIIPMENRKFDEILVQHSSDADLVFLGLAKPDKDFLKYYDSVQERIKELPTTILALASQNVSFGEILIKKEMNSDA